MKIDTSIYTDYDFTTTDMSQLKCLASLMLPHKERMSEEFYKRLLANKETAKHLHGQDAIDERIQTMRTWYVELFSGCYDRHYLKNIEKVGYSHKKINLDCHYVNAAMHFVRNFCIDIIRDAFEDREERRKNIIAMQKILDINLDILTLSYRKAELTQVFVSKRFETLLINFCERFSHGMNIMLVLGLVGLSLSVLALFGHEVYSVVTGHVPMEQGIITSLGTLLIIWVMIELVNTEIKHLKGGHFSIKVFVEVAMVSFLRDALVASLNHEDPKKLLILGLVILILGFVYWLIYRTEIPLIEKKSAL